MILLVISLYLNKGLQVKSLLLINDNNNTSICIYIYLYNFFVLLYYIIFFGIYIFKYF